MITSSTPLIPNNIPAGYLGFGNDTEDTPLSFAFSNMIVAGDIGSGKTTFLTSLAYQSVQQGLETYFVDSGQLVFPSDVWGQVARTQQDTDSQLNFLHDILARRAKQFDRANTLGEAAYQADIIRNEIPVNNLAAYNKIATMFQLETLSPFVLFFIADGELSDNGNFDKFVLQSSIKDIMLRAREYGGYIVLSRHSWNSDGIQGIAKGIRQSSPLSVCFRTNKKTSETLLGNGNSGGEKLPTGSAIVQHSRGLVTIRIYQVGPHENLTPEMIANSKNHIWKAHATEVG